MIWNFLAPFICNTTLSNGSQIKCTGFQKNFRKKAPIILNRHALYSLCLFNARDRLPIDLITENTASTVLTNTYEVAQKQCVMFAYKSNQVKRVHVVIEVFRCLQISSETNIDFKQPIFNS